MENAFEHLTADDRALMVEKGDTKEYQKGDVILEEGDRRRILYIIIEGSCRVEQSHLGKGIAVANLGPDEFFGDMSFLEGIGASASVVADEPVKVLSITPDSVSTLLQSVPGLATRFYQSLSVNLSRRLRETTAMFPKLLVEEVAEVQLFHPEHTGLAGEAQIPPSLMEDVGDFKTAMLGIEQEIIAGKTPEDKIQEKVSGACQAMKDSLNKHIENETLLDRAVGGYVLRETFPYFMSGRLTDRAYTKPRGYSGDFGTIEILYENVEKGDGRLGPFIDRWAMDLKSSQAVRNRRTMMSGMIGDLESAWTDANPMPVCSLASGPAREVFDLLTADDPANIQVTCLDIDNEAIGYASNLAEVKSVASRVTFALDNVIRLALGRGRVKVEPQQLIYSMGLIDYLEDKLVVSLLDWIHDTLLPGGKVALGNFATGSPDKNYLDHIAEWILLHRTPDDLRDLFSSSKFGDTQVDILEDASGVQLLAVAQKA